MKTNNHWVTKARIVCLHKVYPEDTLITSIPLEDQYAYDCSSRYAGGCGTYRLLTGQKWELLYYVYKPGYGCYHPLTYCLDVHTYFTQTLLPRLGWQRVSARHLEQLKEILVGIKIRVRSTTPAVYGQAAEEFIPDGFDSWEQFFDELFKEFQP